MSKKKSFKMDDSFDEDDDTPFVFDNFPELFYYDYLKQFPKRNINLKDWKQLRSADLRQMVADFPPSAHLAASKAGVSAYDSINLSGCENIDEDGLQSLLKSTSKSCTSLKVERCPKAVTTPLMKRVMHSFKILSVLDVTGCGVRDEALEEIRMRPRFAANEEVKGIETLLVADNDLITDIGVMAVLKSSAADSLKVLDISGCHRITDMALMTSFQSASKFQHLISLNISRINITSLGIAHVAKVCHSLVTFIAQHTLINDPSLYHMGKTLKKLKTFDIECCTLVTNDGILSLLDYDMDMGDDLEQELKAIKAKRFRSKADMTRLATEAQKQIGCRSLTSINLKGCYNVGKEAMIAIASRAPGLTSLDISGLNRVDNNSFLEVSKKCLGIKRLRISGRLNTTSAAAMKEEKASADAEAFEAKKSRGTFFGMPRITEEGVLSLKSKELENIVVSGCVAMTSKSVQHFAKCGGANLRVLRFKGVKNVTDDVILEVGRSCPSIVVLDLSGCELVTDKSIKQVSNGCQQLKELYAKDCWRLTDVSFASLMQKCKRLEVLDMRENTNMTHKSIDSMVEKYQIQRVSLCRYATIDIEYARKIAKKLPLIKYVSQLGDNIVFVPHEKVILASLTRQALHKRSASAIQYRFRAWSASRRRLSAKIAAAEKIFRRRVDSATEIQRVWRGKIGRRIARKQRKIMRAIRKQRRIDASIRIQCFRRCVVAKRLLILYKRGSNYFRFRSFRRFTRRAKLFIKERRNDAATAIQGQWRVYLSRKAFRRLLLFRDWQANNIQRVWFGHKGRCIGRRVRRLRTALALSGQRLYHGRNGRRVAANIREERRLAKECLDDAAKVIQSLYRHCRRRKKWELLVARVVVQRTYVARKMQKCYRGWAGRAHGRKWLYKWQFYRPTPIMGSPGPRHIFTMEFSHRMYQRQQEMNIVATLIQAAFRGKVDRDYVRQYRATIHREHSAAVTLQYFWHHLKRKVRRYKFEVLMAAAAKLQSVRRRRRDAESTYEFRTHIYRKKRIAETDALGIRLWTMMQEGSALTIQSWFRKERARLHAPFVRTRRRNVAALMMQALFRGYRGRIYATYVFTSRSDAAVQVQRYYRYYRRNLAWRLMLKQGIINRLDYNRKRKAMNISLQNTKKHIEAERRRMNEAAVLIGRVWRHYWKNESFAREAAAAATREQFLIEREAKRDKERDMRTPIYKVKSKLNPSKFPPLPPHPDDHMDEETRRRILGARDRAGEVKERLDAVIQRNERYRIETKKYKMMTKQISSDLPEVKSRVEKFEHALMEEIEKTSKFYIGCYSPIEVKVFEMENMVQEGRNIAYAMLRELGVFDRIDIRRLLLKQSPKIRELLPFVHIKPREFYAAIDRTQYLQFHDKNIICAEGELGDFFYIITDGTVVVTGLDADDEVIELARLQRNASFGEMALVNPDGLRTATCIAEGPVRTLALHRDRFLKLLSKRSRQVIEFEVEKLKKKFRRQQSEKKKKKEKDVEYTAEEAARLMAERAARIADATRQWAAKNQWRNSVSRERLIVSRRVAQSALKFVTGKIKRKIKRSKLSRDIVREALLFATNAITLGVRVGHFQIPQLSKEQLDKAMRALGKQRETPYFNYEEDMLDYPSARSLGSAFDGLDEEDTAMFQTLEYDLMDLEGDGLLILHELEQVEYEAEGSYGGEDENDRIEREFRELEKHFGSEDKAVRKQERVVEKLLEREVLSLEDYDWVGSTYSQGGSNYTPTDSRGESN